ncbi:hypothetical protein M441DRAFT_419192 [Trichoderma asperellum CBS 433.97]|uniref:Uncharacterized protein n=1 Tax=Trichoderma asperellum (strain ATCC 204424 / CBS 433.97 / NBRC 101777) TaxID=1042311 RepID=A0A2T3Z8Q2_TRIA4|nr:hypothetical protein M441DRAFT_419192 [Trichoderma asperellum CBS 433.97]PTB41176.1 hypothetical protein M441DRAFT_419192 [Trichoderma asperellum CBS 433.97]
MRIRPILSHQAVVVLSMAGHSVIAVQATRWQAARCYASWAFGGPYISSGDWAIQCHLRGTSANHHLVGPADSGAESHWCPLHAFNAVAEQLAPQRLPFFFSDLSFLEALGLLRSRGAEFGPIRFFREGDKFTAVSSLL